MVLLLARIRSHSSCSLLAGDAEGADHSFHEVAARVFPGKFACVEATDQILEEWTNGNSQTTNEGSLVLRPFV